MQAVHLRALVRDLIVSEEQKAKQNEKGKKKAIQRVASSVSHQLSRCYVSKGWLGGFLPCVAVVTVHRAMQLSAQSVVIVWLIFQMYLYLSPFGAKPSFGLQESPASIYNPAQVQIRLGI